MGETDDLHWRALLAEKRRFTAVVDGGQTPVALVSARPGDLHGEGHLSYLFVEPDAQRRGLGSALHDAALEWMRGQAFTEASLRVAVDNAGARRFYEAHGWNEAPGGASFDPFLEREMLEYERAL